MGNKFVLVLFLLMLTLPMMHYGTLATIGAPVILSVTDRPAQIRSETENYIPDVPFHYQINEFYCGPAALEMVFDFYGEDIPQTEIADVARTLPSPFGTTTGDLRRAAHFSNISTSLGMTPGNITGYSNRKYGYIAFEKQNMSLNELKNLVDSGYPLIVLTKHHFRVVMGYNSTHIIAHDPWNNIEWGIKNGGPNLPIDVLEFLSEWGYSYNWGLFVHPLEVTLTIPTYAQPGDPFIVTAKVSYLCPPPFSATEYEALYCNATITLPTELILNPRETFTKTLQKGNLTAGNYATVTWFVKANVIGNYTISVEASGKINGTVARWGTFPSYDYEDIIGGTGKSSVQVKNFLQVPTDYPTIQEAINAASPGNVIWVGTGTYHERLVINKSVTLVGRKAVVIDGDATGTVVHVTARDIRISNFTIQNGHCGIWLDYSKNIFIEKTVIKKAYYGIFITNSTGNEINGNTIENNTFGIYLIQSSLNIFIDNVVTGNMYGSCLTKSDHNVIFRNAITNNTYFGINLTETEGEIIDNNAMANNENGIYLCNSSSASIKSNEMTGNRYNFGVFGHTLSHFIHDVSSNIVNSKKLYYVVDQKSGQVPADVEYVAIVNSTNILLKDLILKNNYQGILLAFSRNCILTNVSVSNNYYGVDFEHSNGNKIFQNSFSKNNYGAYLSHSNANVFCRNQFFDNTSPAASCESFNNAWDNGAEGNYWNDYAGQDQNSDGIGDIPYIIDVDNRDNCPLIVPWSPTKTFYAGIYRVATFSNSTVAGFYFNESQREIVINVTGASGTLGFCNITFPTYLMRGSYTVFVDDLPVTLTKTMNSTHTALFFTYVQSTHEVKIKGESLTPKPPEPMLIPILAISALAAVILREISRESNKKRQ